MLDICTQWCNGCSNTKKKREFLLTLPDKLEFLSMWNVKSGKWNYCAAYNRELIFVGSAETINFTFHFSHLKDNFRYVGQFSCPIYSIIPQNINIVKGRTNRFIITNTSLSEKAERNPPNKFYGFIYHVLQVSSTDSWSISVFVRCLHART